MKTVDDAGRAWGAELGGLHDAVAAAALVGVDVNELRQASERLAA